MGLRDKRKEAFDWAECMDGSGHSVDEILEDLRDKIETQDKAFIKELKISLSPEEIRESPNWLVRESRPFEIIDRINKLAGPDLI